MTNPAANPDSLSQDELIVKYGIQGEIAQEAFKTDLHALLSQEILKELEHIKIMHDQHPLQVDNCAILKSAIEARISFWKGEQK